LVGRNYVGYGETQNENFVWMLENFANDFPPARPLQGQTWFNTLTNILHVYDGSKWTIVGSAVISNDPPDAPSNGAMWLKSPFNTLHVWADGNWRFIGPETAEGFGITRAVSTTILDGGNVSRPIIKLTIDGSIIGIISSTAFTINPSYGLVGFSNLAAGLTLNSSNVVKGNLSGNAATATRLITPRLVNGTLFDGSENIDFLANTTNRLKRGTYLTGTDFNGSTEVTWAVDASSANQAGKVVARNSTGGFSAGAITATLLGNVTASSGTSTFDVVQANTFIGATLSGNAATATKLTTPRKINNVNFDGTADISIPAAAETLTGDILSPSVLNSSLTDVGTLNSLNVADLGVTVGGAEELTLGVQGGTPTLSANQQTGFLLKIFDTAVTGDFADIGFITSAQSLSSSGINQPAFAPNFIHAGDPINLGTSNNKWDKIYANTLVGNAETATLATRSTNIAGGSAGSVPYQTASGTTAFLPAGTPGYVLKSTGGNSITWGAMALERLTAGNYIAYTGTGSPSYYDTNLPLTISVDATSANTASKVVARDASGNFNATMITSGVTLLANPTIPMHATTKQYVDTMTLPAGGIIMWTGSVAAVPTGWRLCDGSGGTPDLRGRFVIGAGGSYGVGATGGTADAVVVSHTHGVSDPGHNHYQSGYNLVGPSGNIPWYNWGNPATATNVDRTGNANTGISINSAGQSGVGANLPPYYALCYIMKL